MSFLRTLIREAPRGYQLALMFALLFASASILVAVAATAGILPGPTDSQVTLEVIDSLAS